MVFPIVAYGHPVLRKVAGDIGPDYPGLAKLVEDMWETMYASSGVGLAAPQINKDIRLFVVDTVQMFSPMKESERKDYQDAPGVKEVFINAHVMNLDGEEWLYNEGCLSIPDLRGRVPRYKTIHVQALDRSGNTLDFIANDFHARVIQHEFDHLNGKVYLDRMRNLTTLTFLQEFARYWLRP